MFKSDNSTTYNMLKIIELIIIKEKIVITF